MTPLWSTSKLRALADIRVSNVDKKSYSTERPVRLCNYMDVYANDYVTSALEFMPATASPSEIERFALRSGDVVMTKDSETPDDIGVPAVLIEDIDDLVCGYHLALIRPKPGVHPVYLAKQLASEPTVRYFAVHATGSTRFGLAIGTIESLDVPNPPIAEQAKIAEVLLTVDRAIEQTEALIAKQQRIKTGLMQDLLTRGIDQDGNLRSEHTHEFKDSPLGRVPAKWEVATLATFVPSAEYGISTSLGESGYPVLRMNNLFDGEAELSDLKFTDAPVPEHLWLRNGDVLFNRTNSWEHVGRTGIWRGQIERATFASYLVRLNPNPAKLIPELLNMWLNWERTQIAMRRHATPAVQQVNINPTNLRSIAAAFPTRKDEQIAIVDRFTGARDLLDAHRAHLRKLQSLKRGLMQDLLSGDRPVTALLELREAVTA